MLLTCSRVLPLLCAVNKQQSGTLLAADLILHWLVRGQEALARLTDTERAALPAWPELPQAASPQALVHQLTRCYGEPAAPTSKLLPREARTPTSQRA